MTPARIVGVLLAAGVAARFGADKRLAPLRDPACRGVPLAIAACRNLVAAVPDAVAVVRPGDDAAAPMLREAGARIVECARAEDGMGASLACGIAAARDADGWIVALADMPWIAPATIARVADALRAGAPIAAPFFEGRRGHPVGFAGAHRDALLALAGDEGARSVVEMHAASLVRIDVEDAGVLRDVDRAADLVRGG